MGDSPLTLRCKRKVAIGGRRREAVEPMRIPTGQTQDDIPRASPSGIHFLRTLDVNDYEKVEFSARLTTYSDNGKEIGSFSVSISSSSSSSSASNGLSEDVGFVVRASSVGRLDGVLCGTKLKSFISRHMLETIEHHQHDFLFLSSDDCLKRDTDVVKQTNGMSVTQTTSRAQDVKKTTRFVDERDATGLITEGADLIVQRILALRAATPPPDFLLTAIDINCNIAHAKYERLEEKMESALGLQSGLFGICRTVMTWKDNPLSWHSYFTSNGQLTFRHQIGSVVSMRLQPNDDDRTQIEGGDVASSLLKSRESETTTKSRSVLASNYTNGKTKSCVDSKTYVRYHPELNTITTDFLQLLLIQKPSNVPRFAANYFSALATETETSVEATAVGTT